MQISTTQDSKVVPKQQQPLQASSSVFPSTPQRYRADEEERKLIVAVSSPILYTRTLKRRVRAVCCVNRALQSWHLLAGPLHIMGLFNDSHELMTHMWPQQLVYPTLQRTVPRILYQPITTLVWDTYSCFNHLWVSSSITARVTAYIPSVEMMLFSNLFFRWYTVVKSN